MQSGVCFIDVALECAQGPAARRIGCSSGSDTVPSGRTLTRTLRCTPAGPITSRKSSSREWDSVTLIVSCPVYRRSTSLGVRPSEFRPGRNRTVRGKAPEGIGLLEAKH